MSIRSLAAVLIAVLALSGCSDDGGGASSDATETTASASDATTTTSEASAPTETTETTQQTDDRTVSTEPSDQQFDESTCAALEGAIQVLTLPVEGDGDREEELDAGLARIDAAIEAAPGFAADQLARLREDLVAATDAIVADGQTGWLEAVIASRAGGEDTDIEVQVFNLRTYVQPRC